MRLLPIAVAVLLSLSFRPAPASGQETTTVIDYFAPGLTLAAVGGAAAIVANFGTIVHMADYEHAGAWGWLAIAAGTTTAIGGLILSNETRKARTMGGLTFGAGIATISLGIAGLALPRRSSPYHITSLAFVPLDDGGGVALLGWY